LEPKKWNRNAQRRTALEILLIINGSLTKSNEREKWQIIV
jgi:hypothetical protein